MRIGKILAIAVVGVASIIVLGAAVMALRLLWPSGSGVPKNEMPSTVQETASPSDASGLISQAAGNSSFLYRKSASGAKQRLTSASSGLESEASFSHDGKLFVYSFAPSQEAKSSIWIVAANGENPHSISGLEQDALHPVFSPDDTKVFYAASSRSGHNSPIVAPARHDWDLFWVPIHADATVPSAEPTQISHESFYDMHSIDVAHGNVPGENKILISTTGYPIGSLFEEFYLGDKGGNKIFQPHVPGESSLGPSFGEARFIHDGMDMVFLAATNKHGGNYDYNVYSISDVTGSQIKQLTQLTGMTTELKVNPKGFATFINDGASHTINVAVEDSKQR